MQLGVVVEGDLLAIVGESVDVMSGVVTDAVNRASLGLRDELRGQVRGLHLSGGASLEKAWQQKLYPSRRTSMGAAGYVYSKARRLHAAYAMSGWITARSGRWLVVPLPGAVARGWHLAAHEGGFGRPRKWSAFDRILKLRGVVRIPLPSGRVLVGLRGPGGKVEPVFLLVRQVRQRGGLDLRSPPQRWLDRLHADLASQIGG